MVMDLWLVNAREARAEVEHTNRFRRSGIPFEKALRGSMTPSFLLHVGGVLVAS